MRQQCTVTFLVDVYLNSRYFVLIFKKFFGGPECVGNSLLMSPCSLVQGVGRRFKWNLDSTPPLCREQNLASAPESIPSSSASVIGGSNSKRLNAAFAATGISTLSLEGGGWVISHISVNAFLPKLAKELDPSVPTGLHLRTRQLSLKGHHGRRGFALNLKISRRQQIPRKG
jgi:hypothetical protein